ncbi:uncharacterized protein DNG_04647 [Cephalotrichum gorgonifer]|uniref:NACHT domain-containing protein n=1 Tax=Cephalotrichum gorgonifer TaxID=2041049 RepID=A0AAE8MYI7_9PEZI|nr:uncharacterized protein DNG_04647 [Cephalotrichum gorgonifer]
MALDPFTAIGLAGNVCQFIAFASAIITAGSELYTSGDGTLTENADLETVTRDLVSISDRLRDSLRRGNQSRGSQARDDAEKPMDDAISGCVAAAKELLDALEALKVKGDKLRTWKSVCKGLRSVWSRGQINSLQKRLALYQAELECHLLVDLREQVSLQQIENTVRFQELDQATQAIAKTILSGEDVFKMLLNRQMDQISDLHEQTNSRMLEEFENTRSEMRKLLSDKHSVQDVPRLQIRQVFGASKSIPWGETGLHDQQVMRDIRDSLYYPELKERQEDILVAYPDTFNWIFHKPSADTRPWDSFMDWLMSDDPIYWIHGKPGAGKSTLMRFLVQHGKTKESLRTWAGANDYLVTASFYFWNSGKIVQRTREGLLRSILWTVLYHHPALCPVVLREEATEANRARVKSGTMNWTRGQLKQLMENLLTQETVPVKLFLAIDGLDEYDGDHVELASWFLARASPRVKMVLSSRPWNAFRDAFESVPQLRLQDLVNADVATFVKGRLESHPRMKELVKREPEIAHTLARQIVDKADGVFLWVRLVVGSLLDGLRNHDRISDLQARLEATPPDLKSLYLVLLKNCDANYREQQSRYIQMRQAAREPPLTLAFSLADDRMRNLTDAANLTLMTRGEALDRCEELERRLQAACAGLLEIDYREKTHLSDDDRGVPLDNHDYYKSAFGSHVQYIHRTVRDFFSREDVSAEIRAWAAPDFDPYASLCRGWVLRLMRLPIETMGRGSMGSLGVGQVSTTYQEALWFSKRAGEAGKQMTNADLVIAKGFSGAGGDGSVRTFQVAYLKSLESSRLDGDEATKEVSRAEQPASTKGTADLDTSESREVSPVERGPEEGHKEGHQSVAMTLGKILCCI